ncbi:growth hormone secretagogue receptor type 1 [Lingula anatina]|uniref:Growth hormone secretagogue receptor type 1 n=1 Tax=Lingula anatina TaxID=7574 RepID=A0A1S3J1Y0_LINAN|nr:growth hormone secretagogue receptor type 1 [Lingula anatina]XP_013404268.1 growth hormone secretagogue receptor type 1 [Lingula anatina]|eukprot:XP_013404267.1 growth hormone secretagogue receptor type 1 [Lingula anatina]
MPECACNSTVNCTLDLYSRMEWLEILDVYAPVALAVDRYVTPIWYVVGIIGNAIACAIWCSSSMRKSNTAAYYLAALAASDLLFLIFHIVMELKIAWNIATINYPVLCEVFMIVYYTPQYLSPMLVLAFTAERFFAVCFPLKVGLHCTKLRAKVTVFVIIAATFSMCSLQAYLWQYIGKTKTCEFRPEIFQSEGSFGKVWTWSTELFAFALVPLVILGLNICVIKALWELTPHVLPVTTQPGHATEVHPQDNNHVKTVSTFMLLSVSFFVIFMTLPATLVYALGYAYAEGDPCLSDIEIRNDARWQSFFAFITARKIIEEVCLSHYACNIFIYCITGTRFRGILINKVKNCQFMQSCQSTKNHDSCLMSVRSSSATHTTKC